MLELKKISKVYHTAGLTQKALDDVSIIFRKNEFVSILGQSGSGKTTMLNIIGGLDNYTDGDLIINGISTKKYKNRDWDVYRNHRVGFVFQSYNLIPHQTALQNVELALTLSGVGKEERRKRSIAVLKKVGLEKQINKKPNQMSGGQMQRIAIARALVNDPDILLADEPTGALDSETSIQVMNLLKEIAKDKLVIMVTHNPELANLYSTRIVKLLDGKIVGLLGKNGVGKTTTLKLILGLLPLEKGTICLGNYSLYLYPMRYKKQINYVSDSHDIYNNLTGKEYLNFIADMYEVSSETRGKIYTPLIEAFQVERYLNSPIKKLSHGTKQKITIIASLVNDPLLWVLDEPMTGLDVEAVQVLKDLIKSRAAYGKSVLFSSHILEICENLCDKIVIMQAGTLQKTIELRDNPSYISLEDIYLEVVNDVPMDKGFSIK